MIVGYHRSGGSDTAAEKYVIDTIECLWFLCSGGQTTCFLGDFNLPLINWQFNIAPYNKIYKMFLEFFVEHGVYQFVRYATRLENILDLVISNNPQFIWCFVSHLNQRSQCHILQTKNPFFWLFIQSALVLKTAGQNSNIIRTTIPCSRTQTSSHQTRINTDLWVADPLEHTQQWSEAL